MKRLVLVLRIAAAACVFPACAFDLDPDSREGAVKAAAVKAAAGKVAAVLGPARAPLPELNGGIDAEGRMLAGSCEGRTDLCYDYARGRLVYKPARNFMPAIPGMKAENISVRRDRVVFQYSFP